MRALVLSDLHFEFHRDHGRAFVNGLIDDVDVVILAGDIATLNCLEYAMELFCTKFRHVVYVHGNHEHYGTDRNTLIQLTERTCAKHRNLHWLDKRVVEIDGVRFAGAPLWFGKSDAPKAGMTDFRVIRGKFTQWVYQESQAAIDFFDRELREGDVVISHHLPSYRSVAPKWVGSPLNPFFVRPVDDIILRRKPALWIHGHTHESGDYQLGSTRILCNPFGYLRVEENARFNWDLVVEVQPPGVASSDASDAANQAP